MTTVSSTIRYNLSGVTGVVGQNPFKSKATFNTIHNWKYVDKLNKLSEFSISVPNDEFGKSNAIVERNIFIPFLSPYRGFIGSRRVTDSNIILDSKEFATHLERRIFKNDEQKRVTYTDEDWYDPLWGHRNKFTVKKTHVSDDVKEYPIPLRLDNDEGLRRHARLDGFDFVVTDKDGITKIPHEIESYDSDTGTLRIWIKLPKVANNSNTIFYIYYDNADATDQQDIVNVWKGCYLSEEGTTEETFDYNGVWHLDSDSVDSTENSNDGADTNIVYVPGKIGNAAQFDALTSKITVTADDTIADIFKGNQRSMDSVVGNPDSNSSLVDVAVQMYYSKVSGLIPGSKIDKVQIEITTSAGNFRLGLYDHKDGKPNNLLTEIGSTASPGTGIRTFSFPDTITVTDNGILWAAIQVDGNTISLGGGPPIGSNSAPDGNWYIETNDPYGALPATATVGTSTQAWIWFSLLEETQNGGGWVSTWINPNSDGENDLSQIFNKESTNTILQLREELDGFLKLRFFKDFTTVNGDWVTTNPIIPINTWTKLDVVYNETDYNNVASLYINGELVTTVTTTTQPTVNDPVSEAANDLIIGNEAAAARTFDGEIEEFRMMNVIPHDIDHIISTNYKLENDIDCIVKHPHEEYKRPADLIAQDIIDSANIDQPLLDEKLITGLVSLYKLDRNALDGKGTNHGTWTGTELYTEGVYAVDKASDFDGASQISLGAGSDFDYTDTTTFSISFWFKSTTGGTGLVVKSDDTGNGAGIKIYINGSGNIVFRMANGADNATITSAGVYTDNLWHFVCCTKSAVADETGMTIYLDEVSKTDQSGDPMSGTYTNAVNMTIGAQSDGGGSIIGQIDDVRFYDRVLNAEEVDALYNATQSDIDTIRKCVNWKLGTGQITDISGLLALWKFDSNLLDSKGNHHLTLQSGTEQYVDDSVYKKAAYFDNLSYYYADDPDGDFEFERTDTFSLSFWTKWGVGGVGRPITKNTGNNTRGIQTNNANNGAFTFKLVSTSTSSELSCSGDDQIFDDDEWHHTVWTYAGTSLDTGVKLYVDGINRGFTASPNNLTTTIITTGELSIGANNDGTSTLIGSHDDMRVYDRVLTPEEVKALYEATSSGLDRVRNDSVPTDITSIGFNFKNHWESLNELSLVLGKDVYFDNEQHKVFIETKGKTITEKLDIVITSNPEVNTENFANEINLLGKKDEFGTQLENDKVVDTVLRYNYEKVVSDGQLNTPEYVDGIADNMVKEFQKLTPQIKGEVPIHQFHRLALQSGDIIPINQPRKNVVGNFRIMDMTVTAQKARLSLEKSETGIIRVRSNSFTDTIGGIIGRIRDGDISS